MDKKEKFNANLYSAFLESKTSKEENRIVLTQMIQSPRLIMELNLASAVYSGKGKIITTKGVNKGKF